MIVDPHGVTFRTFLSYRHWREFSDAQQRNHEVEKSKSPAHPQGPCWRCCLVCRPDWVPEIRAAP